LYQPPGPMHDNYSRLAGVIEDYFQSGDLPWNEQRSFLMSEVLSRLGHKIGGNA